MCQEDCYALWFENQSTRPGWAIIYQDRKNAFAGEEIHQIAWMVRGANPSSSIQFRWTLDYTFFWVDRASKTRQKKLADLETANSTVLSHNEFGYLLSDPSKGTGAAGTLQITQDASVLALDQKTIVGIGMSGAGTFAAPVSPNETLTFTPQPPSSYLYYITFGDHALRVGDVLDPSALNPSQTIHFSPGITSMTAVLDSTNSWTVTQGGSISHAVVSSSLLYEAGSEFDLQLSATV
jgi:hypothetical protein